MIHETTHPLIHVFTPVSPQGTPSFISANASPLSFVAYSQFYLLGLFWFDFGFLGLVSWRSSGHTATDQGSEGSKAQGGGGAVLGREGERDGGQAKG